MLSFQDYFVGSNGSVFMISLIIGGGVIIMVKYIGIVFILFGSLGNWMIIVLFGIILDWF